MERTWRLTDPWKGAKECHGVELSAENGAQAAAGGCWFARAELCVKQKAGGGARICWFRGTEAGYRGHVRGALRGRMGRVGFAMTLLGAAFAGGSLAGRFCGLFAGLWRAFFWWGGGLRGCLRFDVERALAAA